MAATGKNVVVAMAGGSDDTYETVGPREYLDRLLAEYGLRDEEIGDRVRVRTPARGTSGLAPPQEYLVHESVLRSHGDFPCAGDTEALTFCEAIADAMARHHDISRREAVARVNRQWSQAGPAGRVPRVWIVGLDIVYHEDADYWAGFIYHGPDSRWWDPGTEPQPLPPP
ncbi:hypothetical protein Van01_42370 [Micromonospora andamanensis]|uniref:Uncharacterized protein n=1 Tax=Micromonospora andamanensis TaxID=1287068 RepID=A0ABQ4HZC0_9ACTN|nr:hypothetical protein Van01_42370 [Micromonospora andamanensis]